MDLDGATENAGTKNVSTNLQGL